VYEQFYPVSATMLALRDQENLVHAHQTVAASKPLTQGIKQLQPKTPGARAPKTPFKVPLNDENDSLAFGKKTVKGGGKQNGTAKPSVKDAFVTPMGKHTGLNPHQSLEADRCPSRYSSARSVGYENDKRESQRATDPCTSRWDRETREDR
jgi:hypothetical protein